MYDAEVFERLASAVVELDIPVDGDAIAEAYRLRDLLDAKLSQAVGAYDASGQWEVEGATSTVAWLRSAAGTSGSTANATVRTARLLHRLPVTRTAWLEGSFSGGQVQAVAANVDERTVELFAEHEAELVPRLVELSTAETATALRVWKARAEAMLPDGAEKATERRLHLSETLGGRWVLDGELDVEGGGLLATAIRLASTKDSEDESQRTPARRRADALLDVCRFFLDHQQHLAGAGTGRTST
jgi:hypothetical protein